MSWGASNDDNIKDALGENSYVQQMLENHDGSMRDMEDKLRQATMGKEDTREEHVLEIHELERVVNKYKKANSELRAKLKRLEDIIWSIRVLKGTRQWLFNRASILVLIRSV